MAVWNLHKIIKAQPSPVFLPPESLVNGFYLQGHPQS